MRAHLSGSSLAGEKGFRWRGGEITRLEGFSDAVFALAVTLLVVSLEVPRNFDELVEAMRGFVAFGICFAILADVWFAHYRFFRRYGLQNPWTVFLNCVLLFFVLLYVYPLKYLFVSLFRAGAGIQAAQARTLFVIYGLGYAAVFFVLAMLYLHAWNMKDDLELNQIERLRTRHSLVDHVAMATVGVASAGLALILPERLVGLAGYFYFVIGVYFTLAGMILGGRERSLVKETMGAPPSPGVQR